MKTIKFFFKRISTDSDRQNIEDQDNSVIEKFNLENLTLKNLDETDIEGYDFKEDVLYELSEEISGFNLEKIHKRYALKKFLRILVKSHKRTFEEFIFEKLKSEYKFEIYCFGAERIIRNMVRGILIGFIFELFDIKIYSVKDGLIEKKENESLNQFMARALIYVIVSFTGENSSLETSKQIKKAVKKEGDITYGTSKKHEILKPRKWGRKFKNLEGLNVDVSLADNKKLIGRIKVLKRFSTIKQIKEKIAKEFNLKLSDGYISGVK